MADDTLTSQDREWLRMIAERPVGPVPIDDELMVKFVRMGLVNADADHPALTDAGKTAASAAI